MAEAAGSIRRIKPEWKRVAMEVPSSASAENYGWMTQVPRIREWLGEPLAG